MSPKVSLAVLIALLAVATALAATAHSANQNGENFFGKVKSVFIEDGKINTIPAGVVAVIILAITALVRGPNGRHSFSISFFSANHPPSLVIWLENVQLT